MRRRVLSLLVVALAVGGCGSNKGNKADQFAALSGKRLPGAPSTWTPIGSPLSHPVNVSTTITPPVSTGALSADGAVSFFDFGSTADASAFYRNPPLEAREVAISLGILQYRSLRGATGVPQPSRGLDLRTCLWSGGPNQGGTRGKGELSGGTMSASGVCSQGTSSSIGVAMIVQRGNVVFISQSTGTDAIGRTASRSELTSPRIGVVRHAKSALALMQEVGLAS